MEFQYFKKPSVVVLILANLVPLAGVLFYSWNAFDLIMLYWLENIVIIFFNMIKLGYCNIEDAKEIKISYYAEDVVPRSRRYLNKSAAGKKEYLKPPALPLKHLPFYYGIQRLIFMVITGFAMGFVFFVSGPYKLAQVLTMDFFAAFMFFVVRYGFSFLYNFIGQKEYLAIRSMKQIEQTETGHVSLYLGLMAGAWFMPAFFISNVRPIPMGLSFSSIPVVDIPMVVLAFIVMVKTKLDLESHIRRHAAVLDGGAIGDLEQKKY